MTTSSRVINQENAADVLEQVQYILLDIDGVVWSGDTIIPGVPETLHYLRNVFKKQIRFISNNVLLSRQEIVQEFAKKGITGVMESEVYNAGYAAALRLQQLLGKPTPTSETTNTNDINSNKENESNLPLVHGNVFVIGEQGLCDEIQRVLAPGYITYGTELNDMNAIGVPYTSHLFANAWTQRILPAPASSKKWCSYGSNMCNTNRNESNKLLNKHDNSYKINKYKNKISLSDLKAVAVVAGLDLHFNICKLACASMILQGSSATALKHEQQAWDHKQNEQRQSQKRNEEQDNIYNTISDSTSAASVCSNSENNEIICNNSNRNRCDSSKCVSSKVAQCAPALYIATNPDPCDPAGVNLPLMPASGSIIAALTTCSTRLPHAICGKPELDMAKILFANEHISNPSETCLMIGDRLTTDIAFGNAAGCKTMLVLSGVDQQKEVNDAICCNKNNLIPNYIANSLAVFLSSNSAVLFTTDSKDKAIVCEAKSITTTTAQNTSNSQMTFAAKL